MNTSSKSLLSIAAVAALALVASAPAAAESAKATASQTAKNPVAAGIDHEVDAGLKALYAATPAAKALGAQAKGVLVFPSIVKGGLVVGGQYGKGALRKGATSVGYYETAAASFGLQAGAQKYGYAMFFMSDEALAYLDSSEGWEVGVGPSIVVVDKGAAASLTNATLKDNVYVFFFNQKGLMAGAGVQGSKISRLSF